MVEVLVGNQHGGRAGDQLRRVREERSRVDEDAAAVVFQLNAGVDMLGEFHRGLPW